MYFTLAIASARPQLFLCLSVNNTLSHYVSFGKKGEAVSGSFRGHVMSTKDILILILNRRLAASEAGEGNGSSRTQLDAAGRSRTQLDAAARSRTQPHAAESAAQGFDFARGGGEGPERSKE